MQNWQRKSAFTRIAVIVVLLALAMPAAAGAWTWPVPGPVLQGFAFDEDNPLLPGQHRGIDLQGTLGDPVVAPAAGTVTFTGKVAANGLTITIQTADGYTVTLLHLGSFLVGRGVVVAEGQPVAVVGTSGVPAHSVPYVQLGIRLSSDPQGYLDPLRFLPPLAAPAPKPSEPPAPTPALSPPPVPAPVTPPPAPSLRVVMPVGAPETRPVLELPAPTHSAGPQPSIPVLEPLPVARAVNAEPPVSQPTPVDAAAPAPVTTPPATAPAPPGGPWFRAPDPEPVVGLVEPPGRTFPWKLLAAVSSLLAAAALAARGHRKAARIIEGDALLPDDTHLLRQREPAHRARVHDDRGRRSCPAPPAARRGDLLPHGH